MEYLTLLDYLYVITFNSRKKAAQGVTFFLSQHLTVLNNFMHIDHKRTAH